MVKFLKFCMTEYNIILLSLLNDYFSGSEIICHFVLPHLSKCIICGFLYPELFTVCYPMVGLYYYFMKIYGFFCSMFFFNFIVYPGIAFKNMFSGAFH